MKTSLFIILIGLFSFSVVAQSEESISLKWKILPSDTLLYKTTMDEIDSTLSIPSNFPTAFLSIIDTVIAQQKRTKEQDSTSSIFDDILAQEISKKPALVSELTTKKPGIINIKMYKEYGEAFNAAYKQEMKTMLEDAQKLALESKTTLDSSEIAYFKRPPEPYITLDGAVYEDGGIQSFYLQSSQKNILALFFELPKKKLRVGDTWTLEVQLISMAFTQCDSAFRDHKVTFKELKKQGQDRIAVLEYDFVEYASGKAPVGDVVTEYTFKAIAEFSIDTGRWLKYDGIMSMIMEGGLAAVFGNMNTELLFSLRQE